MTGASPPWAICRQGEERWTGSLSDPIAGIDGESDTVRRFPNRLTATDSLVLIRTRSASSVGAECSGKSEWAYSPGGVLDLVAAIVAGLTPLGGLPKLAAQALRTVIQAVANELFGYCLNFFL